MVDTFSDLYVILVSMVTTGHQPSITDHILLDQVSNFYVEHDYFLLKYSLVIYRNYLQMLENT